MPYGKGTYGSKVGRPKKYKGTKKATRPKPTKRMLRKKKKRIQNQGKRRY
jgi:hypothetical protein